MLPLTQTTSSVMDQLIGASRLSISTILLIITVSCTLVATAAVTIMAIVCCERHHVLCFRKTFCH